MTQRIRTWWRPALLCCLALTAPRPATAQQGRVPGVAVQGDALAEMANVLTLPPVAGQPARLVVGDAAGVVHVYEARGDAFDEVWLSRYLEGSISGLEIVDTDADGLQELVVFTDQGRIHYLDLASYSTIWSNSPGEYATLTAQLVADVDDDPQPELLFCANGRLIIYDAQDRFEEWRSDQTGLVTSAMLLADVDGDGEDEIVLNDGYVFDARFRTLEWQHADGFGERMGALDVDADGILELLGEFRGRFVRIFDVDLRREKSLRANY